VTAASCFDAPLTTQTWLRQRRSAYGPIEMRMVRARVPQRIESADEVPADVDYARVLRLQ
jgi:hypothetical protein